MPSYMYSVQLPSLCSMGWQCQDPRRAVTNTNDQLVACTHIRCECGKEEEEGKERTNPIPCQHLLYEAAAG